MLALVAGLDATGTASAAIRKRAPASDAAAPASSPQDGTDSSIDSCCTALALGRMSRRPMCCHHGASVSADITITRKLRLEAATGTPTGRSSRRVAPCAVMPRMTPWRLVASAPAQKTQAPPRTVPPVRAAPARARSEHS